VNGTVTALTVPGGGTFSLAQAISANGQYVAGFGPDIFNGSGESAPYLWNLATGQAGTDLGGDPLGQALGVNNSGQVVGFVTGDYGGSAFLYSNGQLIDLGEGLNSSANAINNAGVVVGNTATSAFVYSNGLATDLNSLVPAGSGFTLTNAVGINDSGQILDQASNGHAVLLNPVASPTLSLSGFPTTTTAGVAHNLTVTVRNPDGSIDTGYTGTVHFASSDPQAVLPADYTFTPADAGVHTFSVTLKTATGVNNSAYTPTITVTDTANPGISGSQTETAVNPGPATHFAVFGGVQSGRTFSVVVEALDSSGNIATGYTGTIHFSDSVRGQALPANYTFKAADAGDHAFTVTFTTRGKHTITVTDTLNATIVGTETIDVT
jgi:probable HAF family extracellular repeat protein